MPGLFVTGTGTGVGKTVLSAALLAAMVAAGEPVRAHKPVVTGLDDPPGAWPPDHELLGAAARMAPEEVAPLRYGPAVSPHLAAQLAGETLDPARLLARARDDTDHPAQHVALQRRQARLLARARDDADHPAQHVALQRRQARLLVRARDDADGTATTQGPAPPGGSEAIHADDRLTIVEGVGGLLVPLAPGYTVRDLAAELGLPLLIAAPPGLGTINHTLLTIEAARSAGIDVRAVVLTPWSARPPVIEQSNRDTIAQLGDVEVQCLPHLPGPDLTALAAAGARLPWRRWLAP
ncbi:MAG TPA: dethiobiotin synthase [Solirubrobacteraceae bacterium]|nr:dethiobiotin synthase [Solirubrobacteraceae bacterium]